MKAYTLGKYNNASVYFCIPNCLILRSMKAYILTDCFRKSILYLCSWLVELRGTEFNRFLWCIRYQNDIRYICYKPNCQACLSGERETFIFLFIGNQVSVQFLVNEKRIQLTKTNIVYLWKVSKMWSIRIEKNFIYFVLNREQKWRRQHLLGASHT